MTTAEQLQNKAGQKISIATVPQTSTSIQPIDFYSDTPLVQPEQSPTPFSRVAKARSNANGPPESNQAEGVK